MFGVAAMGEIQSRHIHTRFQQPFQNPRLARRRPDGANDFGVSKTHWILCTASGWHL
jgi:hypothetical protein